MPSGLWVTMPRGRGSRHATCSVREEAASAPRGGGQWVPQRAWEEGGWGEGDRRGKGQDTCPLTLGRL